MSVYAPPNHNATEPDTVDTVSKPSIIPPNIATIPAEMEAATRWAVWRLIDDQKIPLRSDGRGKASSTDPATWSTLAVAWAAYQTGRYAGLMLALGGGFCGDDLDD